MVTPNPLYFFQSSVSLRPELNYYNVPAQLRKNDSGFAVSVVVFVLMKTVFVSFSKNPQRLIRRVCLNSCRETTHFLHASLHAPHRTFPSVTFDLGMHALNNRCIHADKSLFLSFNHGGRNTVFLPPCLNTGCNQRTRNVYMRTRKGTFIL